jgi:hypothetical protein
MSRESDDSRFDKLTSTALDSGLRTSIKTMELILGLLTSTEQKVLVLNAEEDVSIKTCQILDFINGIE